MGGIVSQMESGRALAGVTVVVSGPTLASYQTEVTDSAGRYLITQLPPGDGYVVSFYFGAGNVPVAERVGVRLSAGKTLTIDATVRRDGHPSERQVIKESAPNVDTASATTGIEIHQEILSATPVRGRTFEEILALAPGSVDIGAQGKGLDIGVGFGGSTGTENTFIIDGLNTTDPHLGLIGTRLSQYFIQEINVLTSGYPAEYGRATGAVVSIITKSGSNQFHGGIYGSFQPFQLQTQGVAAFGEALLFRSRFNGDVADVGLDLGGPLWKDRVTFYAGFAMTNRAAHIDRQVRRRLFDPQTGGGQPLQNYACPDYLADPLYCYGARPLALRTEETEISQQLVSTRRLYNAIVKLQIKLRPDHQITLAYLGAPETQERFDHLLGELESGRMMQLMNVHDFTARYTGKAWNHKLQFELLYGLHHQREENTPAFTERSLTVYQAAPADPYSLADFEDVPACRRLQETSSNGAAVVWNPCPLTSYLTGYGFYDKLRLLERHQLIGSATLYLSFWGIHAFKLGFDLEFVKNDHILAIAGPPLDPNDPSSGARVYTTIAGGADLIRTALAVQDGTGGYNFVDAFRSITGTRNFAIYLRDSWTTAFLPGLTINAGIRWEGQEILDADGGKQISIYDNWAPRIGLVYDFTRRTTRPGRGRLYLNYGRFYESIPMDINETRFSGRAFYGDFAPSGTCRLQALQPGGRQVPVPSPECQFSPDANNGFVNGGYGVVAPDLKGQFINEVLLGINYDVGWDVVLGLNYTHRSFGEIIEDYASDGSAYLIGNPGRAVSPQSIQELEANLDGLRAAATTPGASFDAQLAYGKALQRLNLLRYGQALLPRGRRDYNALALTLSKRLSYRFSMLASYTYSRVLGDYAGTFNPTVGQSAPNTSTQYDLPDMLANKQGPLPSDRPHNFKLTGFYQQPTGRTGMLTVGLTFTAYSGRPIEVLGAHRYYGEGEVFLLPRGTGGRTPAVTQLDLGVGYEQQIGRLVRVRVGMDIINLLNQRTVLSVDDLYTRSIVSPILSGRPEDLLHLREANGSLAVVNSNYGQPTVFQEPLYMRLSLRCTF